MQSDASKRIEIHVEQLCTQTPFMASVSRHFLKFLGSISGKPQNGSMGRLYTPFDGVVNPAMIDDFIQNHCRHTSEYFKKYKEESPEFYELLLRLFRPLVNPFEIMLNDAKLVQGRYFYVLLPIAICGDKWPEFLRTELARKNFDVTFMYGYADGTGARIVFAVKNDKRPIISTVGLATLIAQIFPWSVPRTEKSRTHVPLISLSNAAHLAIALAHVGCKRISFSGERDYFSPSKGDIGCELCRMTADMTRATSFPRLLIGFINQLPDKEMRDEVSRRMTDNFNGRGLKLDLTLPPTGSLFHDSRTTWAKHISCIFQVRDATKPGNEMSSFELLCKRLRELLRSFPGAQWFWFFSRDRPSDNIFLHALLVCCEPVHMYGGNGLLGMLQNIAKSTGYCTCMSLAPVDFDAPNNLLAQAILCGLDDKPSAVRDELLRDLRTPGCTPRFRNPETPLDPRAGTPGPSMQLQVQEQYTTPRGPRAGTPGQAFKRPRVVPIPVDTGARSPSPVAPTIKHAHGVLERLLLQAVSNEFAPGTQGYASKINQLQLNTPDWIFDILEADPVPLRLEESNAANVNARNGVLGCLQVLANGVKPVAKALYFGTVALSDALYDNQDTIQTLLQELSHAHECCRGFEPVIKSFTSIPENELLAVGMKRRAVKMEQAPRSSMPSILTDMPDGNLLKQIYAPMLLAWDCLHEMIPENGDCATDWTRIYKTFQELTHALHTARAQCGKLHAMMLAERDV